MTKHIIKPSTPLANAVISLLSRAKVVLDVNPASTAKIIIFGGCAVHMLTNGRGSADIDAELVASSKLVSNGIGLVYEKPQSYIDNSGRMQRVRYDFNYSNTLGSLHEDYMERAIPIAGFDSDSRLQVFIASGVDLAISKLSRFTEQDKSDIETLLHMGIVNPKVFRKLALEAIDYAVGNKNFMKINLKEVLEPYLGKSHELPEP